MQKAAPSFGRIAVMAAFALSCFGLLLFLWISFGGTIPLKPKGYRVQIAFPEATTLASEAEVRLLALTHLSTRYGGREIRDEARSVFENTVVPRDFDVVEIPFPEKGPPTVHRLDGERVPV